LTDRHKPFDTDALLKGVGERNSLAIARAITAIENQTVVGAELSAAIRNVATHCFSVGVTGPPGAGKSSLISALISELLSQHSRIGVLMVDPSSPVSGGAVLGDRVRMAEHSTNPNVFFRSLAARGHLGGVTRTTRSVMQLLAAAGMDLLIVETVGTGQSEVEVAELTDVKMVVCAPGLGDEMQAIKAGVLEIADLLVINKADLPDAERTAAHLKAMLRHRGHEEKRRALLVSSTKRIGLTALVEAIDATRATGSEGRTRKVAPREGLADDVAALAAALILETGDKELAPILEAMAEGKTSRPEAVRAALQFVAQPGRRRRS
jgi:LAO/AO transport system ATPase